MQRAAANSLSSLRFLSSRTVVQPITPNQRRQPMTTSNLSVTVAINDPSAGELTCTVTPAAPLFIEELVIDAVPGLGAVVGVLRPGTAARPVLRTISVDSTDPVFTTVAPF